MRNNLITPAITAQCALIALQLAYSAGALSIGLALIVLGCLIGMLQSRSKKKEIIEHGGAQPCVAERYESYFKNYLGYLAGKVGEDAAKLVKADVEDILGRETQGRIEEVLAQPESRNRAKGIVTGRVQSGKTQNYTGLITRAIDEGWNTIIVLTSSNISLESQTIARLRKDLAASGLTEEKYVLIDNFLADEIPAMAGLENGKIYVGFALKQTDHLRGRNGNGKGVIGWLKNNEASLAHASVIVIDDESDNATQNTVAGASDWSDESVLRYAESVRREGARSHDEVTIRVAEWIVDIATHDDVAMAQNEQRLNALKAMLEERIGEEEVKTIVRNYAGELRLDRKVAFMKFSADSVGAPRIGGFVEDYFTRRGRGRGHGRGDDFRAILRWFLDVRKPRSAINDCVRTLVSADTFSCEKLAYVGYTATPYANFLNESLGADNPLELDFAQSMSIAPEYFGLMKIFGKDTDSPVARMPIVRTIDAVEQDEATRPFMDGIDIGLDENLNYDYVSAADKTRKQGTWKSLKDAIQWAIVAAAVRRENRIAGNVADTGDTTRADRWTTMLVNLSRKIGNHNGLRDAIQNYLTHALDNVSSFKRECLALFDERVADIDEEHFVRLFPDYPHAVHAPRRPAVEKHLDYVLKHIRVIALNSDAENMTAYCDYTQDVADDEKRSWDWLWIVVGGNRISRGLTFDGLVSSYFDRDGVSVNVDTLTQMGRWFGYRLGYELLPRVWMPTGAIASMKEICQLEEDLHAQLHALFAQRSAKPNPKILAISRRLTRLDNAMRREDGVENPMIVREFFPRTKTGLDGVSVVADFLAGCGPSAKSKDGEGGKVYSRLDAWTDVPRNAVQSFFISLERVFSRPEVERLAIVLAALGKMGDKVDVVLSNPMNKKPVITLANGVATHVHGISECETLEDGSVRFGKFAGQYDAWKAVVPKDIVESVEAIYGAKANTFEAIAKMFALKAERGLENHPVVQVGFIEINEEPVPYVSVYCPGQGDWMTPPTVSTARVVDECSDDVAGMFAIALKDAPYVPESALPKRAKDFLKRVAVGKVAMPQGYGYWRETRSGYGTGSAVFRTEWAMGAQDFLCKLIDEAASAIGAYVKERPSEILSAHELWRTVTHGKYNGILEPTGKHVLPQRLGDCEEQMLLGYGIACVNNGFSRPKVRAL